MRDIGDREIECTLRFSALQEKAIERKLAESALQVGDGRPAQETLDLDRDFVPVLLRRQRPLCTEVDIEILSAELERIRIVGDRPAIAYECFFDSIVKVSLRGTGGQSPSCCGNFPLQFYSALEVCVKFGAPLEIVKIRNGPLPSSSWN